MRTFKDVLDRNKGIGPGFDFLRVALSLSILFTHSFLIATGSFSRLGGPLIGSWRDALVPMFFALSGFLIAGSALRLKLKDFLLNRGLRIVPALAMDIFISALLIGPIFTTLPLIDYFRDYRFASYFANIAGVIHFTLPGVFMDAPFADVVNGSLWTVPYEIGCYVIMSVMITTGLLRRPRMAVVATGALSLWIILCLVTGLRPLVAAGLLDPDGIAEVVLSNYIGSRGLQLYIFFMLGCLAYLFRGYIPHHGGVAALCAAVIVCVAEVFPAVKTGTICALLAPLIVYIIVYLGMSKLPKLPLYSHGDYSYGIYLYGYPLQQALVALFPGLVSPWLHFAVSVPLVTLVAMCSWHVVEKPILRLRRKFSFTARKGDETTGLPRSEYPLPAAGVARAPAA